MLERTINTGLQRSGRSRRRPARFCDPLPTAVPVHLGRRHGIQNQQPAREKDAAEQQPPPDLGLQHDEEVARNPSASANPMHTITNANSFGVFQEYSSLPSHNPRNPDAFADIPIAVVNPQPQSIRSGLAAVASGAGLQHNLSTSTSNRSEDLLLAWMTTSSRNTPAGINDLVRNVIAHPDFSPSNLKGFNAVTAT